jgi:tRNA (cmo5U34)-methyltransferase
MAEGMEETDSGAPLDLARIFTPGRDEIEAVLLALIPARSDERFCCVDVGASGGWLSQRVLQQFSAAQVIAIDGSAFAFARARDRLAPFGARADVRQVRPEDSAWISGLPGGVRVFLSALALRGLDSTTKWTLYRNLYRRLEPGGALLIADVVAPASELEKSYFAAKWDTEVKRQSHESTGNSAAFDLFDAEQWNRYKYADPVEKSPRLLDQLKWLEEVGFDGVGVFWLRAGHAVFGGFKAKPK